MRSIEWVIQPPDLLCSSKSIYIVHVSGESPPTVVWIVVCICSECTEISANDLCLLLKHEPVSVHCKLYTGLHIIFKQLRIGQYIKINTDVHINACTSSYTKHKLTRRVLENWSVNGLQLGVAWKQLHCYIILSSFIKVFIPILIEAQS